uniref:Xylose isomerase-like TIM barrel domain-containing protein n=1 Tax=Parascaris univalens TaxID=6257 RepID=A0A915C5S2_PARUN
MRKRKAVAKKLVTSSVDAEAASGDANNARPPKRSIMKTEKFELPNKATGGIVHSTNSGKVTSKRRVGEKNVLLKTNERSLPQEEKAAATIGGRCSAGGRKPKKIRPVKKYVRKGGSLAGEANILEPMPLEGEECNIEDVHVDMRAHPGIFHAVGERRGKEGANMHDEQTGPTKAVIREDDVSISHGGGIVVKAQPRRGKKCSATEAKVIKEQMESTKRKITSQFEETADSKPTVDSGIASKAVAVKQRKRHCSSDPKGTVITTGDGLEENKELSARPKRKKAAEGTAEGNSIATNPVAEKVKKAAIGSKKMLGAHVSAAGGLENAVYNAVGIGCSSFALFLRNQRSWNAKPLDDHTVERFKTAIKVVPHGSYLVNAGSADQDILKKSRETMLDECKRCERLGIPIYNIHPGSTAGKHTIEQCIDTIAASINYVLEHTASVIIVIETMAGQGSTVGGSFEEIRSIIDRVDKKDRIGVCIDTCHIFAAGYDIRTEETYQMTMDNFERIVGFKYLKAVHLNDSKGGLGSRLDRHENIGKGKLKCAFKYLMRDDRFDGIPMVLETPEGDYAAEMIRLYSRTD